MWVERGPSVWCKCRIPVGDRMRYFWKQTQQTGNAGATRMAAGRRGAGARERDLAFQFSSWNVRLLCCGRLSAFTTFQVDFWKLRVGSAVLGERSCLSASKRLQGQPRRDRDSVLGTKTLSGRWLFSWAHGRLGAQKSSWRGREGARSCWRGWEAMLT